MGRYGRFVQRNVTNWVASGGNPYAYAAMTLSDMLSKPTQGPRLTNLAVQVSEEGQPLVRGWGQWRQAGNLVYSSGLIEHTNAEGGKGGLTPFGGGGPRSETYTYSTSLYIVGGRGPITRINKIWANEKLVYDYNGGTQKGFTLTYVPLDGHYYGEENGVGLRVYTGTTNQPVDALLEAAHGVNEWTAYPDRWGVAVADLPLEDYGNTVPNFTFEVYYSVIDLVSIIEEIGSWVGLADTDFDLTALAGDNIYGSFVLESRQTAASALQQLMSAHHFTFPEVDGVLRAVPRGGASLVTLDEADIRAHVPNESTPETSLLDRQETQLPEVVELQFYDPARRYHPGYRYGRRQVVNSQRKESITYSMSIPADKAEQIARTKVHERWTQSEAYTLFRDLKYLWLAASDVITIPTSQGLKIVSLPELNIPLFGPVTGPAPVSDALLYANPLPSTTDSGVPDPDISVYDAPDVGFINSHAVIGDTTHLVGPVVYAYMSAPYASQWAQGQMILDNFVLSSFGDGLTTTSVLFPLRATFGTAVNALPDYADNSDSWDTLNTLTVDLEYGTLQSAVEADVLEGTNAAWLKSGDDWEILQWQDATYDAINSPAGKRRYVLSNLLRGRRGTEPYMTGHSAGDVFVLINNAVRKLNIFPNKLNATVNYDATVRNQVTSGTFVVEGNNLLPWYPVELDATHNGTTNDWHVTWERRDRSMDAWEQGGATLPMSESIEQYALTFVTSLGATIKTVIVQNKEYYDLLEAEQIADFGGAQTTIRFKVAQYSSVKGYGAYSDVVEITA